MTKMITFGSAITTLMFVMISPAIAPRAHAQEVSSTVTVIATNNYLFRGATQSLHEPTFQVSFDVASGPFYAGAFAANMDFETDANLEIDLYAGYKPKWGSAQMDFAVLGYFYPQEDPLNLMEVKAAATFSSEAGTAMTFSYFYSPEWGKGGPISNYVEASASVPIPSAKIGAFALSANASVGRQNFGTGVIADYTNWKASISATAEKGWFAELAWTDTDLDLEGYKGVVSVTLKKTF